MNPSVQNGLEARKKHPEKFKRRFRTNRTLVHTNYKPHALGIIEPKGARVSLKPEKVARHKAEDLSAPSPAKSRPSLDSGLKALDSVEYDLEFNSFRSESRSIQGREINNAILTAKESLYLLRCEAKLCMESSRRLLQDNSRLYRNSMASEACLNSSNEMLVNSIKDLTQSMVELKDRIEENEKVFSVQGVEDKLLKNAVIGLGKQVEEKGLLMEREMVAPGCTTRCTIA